MIGQAKVLKDTCVHGSSGLASEAVQSEKLLWKIRPKLHKLPVCMRQRGQA